MTAVTLPEGYTMRAPTRDDAAAVAALIAARQVAEGDEAEATANEIVDDWEGLDLAEEAVVLVEPGGGLAAYADVFNRRYVSVSVYGYVHPAHEGRGLGTALVRWGEGWAREHMHHAPPEARVIAQHYLRASNGAARRLLEDHGYAPVRGVYVMATELDAAPPTPEWPAGIAARAFVPGQDERATFDAVEEAFRDMWGRPPGVFERWLDLTQAERRDPGLWLLAEESSGEIAGACLAKATDGRGWIGTVAVRRPWRGRGLGLALLRQSFGEFHRRGIRVVELSVDAESLTGAPRLYSRAGMRVTKDYVIYRKELRAGEDFGARDDAG